MTAFDIYHSLTTSAQSKTNEKPLCWARCPGRKIIDCGPVGPLMMDLSPSCWEGLSPSHFKGPERVIRRLEPLHCQWTKFITLQRA